MSSASRDATSSANPAYSTWSCRISSRGRSARPPSIDSPKQCPDSTPPETLGLSRSTLAQRELTSPPPPTLTVRRYQQVPTPLVRDKVSNWRTGRLDLVMRGHSDIIGS